MKWSLILMATSLLIGCAKESSNAPPSAPIQAPSPDKEQGKQKEQTTENPPSQEDVQPINLGQQINVITTPEQPLIGLRYSKSQKDQFDFNFKVLPSEFGINKSQYLGRIFIRLVSKRTGAPLTKWYSEVSERKADPNKGLFFFQPLYSKSEAIAASQHLQDLAIQIVILATGAPESGVSYWIDLGGFCTTTPQNFMEVDSITTGCH